MNKQEKKTKAQLAIYIWIQPVAQGEDDRDSRHATCLRYFYEKKGEKIPSGSEREQRFSSTKWYLYPYNQRDPTGDTDCLVASLLPLPFLLFSL